MAPFQQLRNSPEIMFYFGVVVITGGYYKGLYCKLRGIFNFIYITEEIDCENDIFIDYEGNWIYWNLIFLILCFQLIIVSFIKISQKLQYSIIKQSK